MAQGVHKGKSDSCQQCTTTPHGWVLLPLQGRNAAGYVSGLHSAADHLQAAEDAQKQSAHRAMLLASMVCDELQQDRGCQLSRVLFCSGRAMPESFEQGSMVYMSEQPVLPNSTETWACGQSNPCTSH